MDGFTIAAASSIPNFVWGSLGRARARPGRSWLSRNGVSLEALRASGSFHESLRVENFWNFCSLWTVGTKRK